MSSKAQQKMSLRSSSKYGEPSFVHFQDELKAPSKIGKIKRVDRSKFRDKAYNSLMDQNIDQLSNTTLQGPPRQQPGPSGPPPQQQHGGPPPEQQHGPTKHPIYKAFKYYNIKKAGLSYPLKAKALMPRIDGVQAAVNDTIKTPSLVMSVDYQKLTGPGFVKEIPRKLVLKQGDVIDRVMINRSYGKTQLTYSWAPLNKAPAKTHHRTFMSLIDKIKPGDSISTLNPVDNGKRVLANINAINQRSQKRGGPVDILYSDCILMIMPDYTNDNTIRGSIIAPGNLSDDHLFQVVIVTTNDGLTPSAGTFWKFPANASLPPHAVPSPFLSEDASSIGSQGIPADITDTQD